MRLAVFDLDHTLLAADSDYLWGQFLCQQGFVERATHEAGNRKFYADYSAGTLDVQAFYAFSLAPLTRRTVAEWLPLRAQFLKQHILPNIAAKAPTLLKNHRAAGDILLLTTRPLRFITEPIAGHLGVAVLMAADPEIVDGHFTGRMAQSNFQSEKVARLKAWIAQQPEAPEHITAYSDSHNDIPLLSYANSAIAVDADPTLTAHAEARGWPRISLRT